jgi:putative ATPase
VAGNVSETIFRRFVRVASEDVGMADAQAMVQVVAAWNAYECIG